MTLLLLYSFLHFEISGLWDLSVWVETSYSIYLYSDDPSPSDGRWWTNGRGGRSAILLLHLYLLHYTTFYTRTCTAPHARAAAAAACAPHRFLLLLYLFWKVGRCVTFTRIRTRARRARALFHLQERTGQEGQEVG